MEFKVKEILLVIIIGRSFFNTPYTTHKPTPIINTPNIIGDTSCTSLDFNDFIICGITATVVQMPAKKPKISIKDIFFILLRPLKAKIRLFGKGYRYEVLQYLL